MRSFFYNLDKMIEDSQNNHNKRLFDLCCDVRDYVLEGSFTKYKKVNTVLAYWGHPDNYVSQMTGMKEGTVRQARRTLSNELYELFGYDFFEAIAVGDEKAISDGKYRLYLAEKGFTASNFLYRDMIADLKSRGRIRDDIDISSCRSEMVFLARHSKRAIEKELEFLDKDKLVYLIRMLDNEVGTPVNVRNLIKYLEKEV